MVAPVVACLTSTIPAPRTVPNAPVPAAAHVRAPFAASRSRAPVARRGIGESRKVARATGPAMSTGLRIVVSLARRHLWVLDRGDTLLSAPAAVASGRSLDFAGRHWTFHAPRAPRTVIAKERNPVWHPPDWLYAETARDYGLALARLRRGHPVRLRDGDLLGVHGDVVGITDAASGRFAALPVDEQIVFDDTLYIPPFTTRNRHVTGALGRYALELGNGYLIHGTPEHDSVGEAVTHGCIRLDDADLKWLYRHVPVGTPVYIH